MLLQMEKFHSLLWLSSFPQCVCLYIYNIYFIHSSVDRHLGHLGSFHMLEVVNNAAMNIKERK